MTLGVLPTTLRALRTPNPRQSWMQRANRCSPVRERTSALAQKLIRRLVVETNRGPSTAPAAKRGCNTPQFFAFFVGGSSASPSSSSSSPSSSSSSSRSSSDSMPSPDMASFHSAAVMGLGRSSSGSSSLLASKYSLAFTMASAVPTTPSSATMSSMESNSLPTPRMSTGTIISSSGTSSGSSTLAKMGLMSSSFLPLLSFSLMPASAFSET
mmetsp:Transcript_99522/g.267309  ORF Transcript_99522/g.267309 Transcript_99522/m.267309 type:complete len:212 (-) Transcript_99522:143-778(-)